MKKIIGILISVIVIFSSVTPNAYAINQSEILKGSTNTQVNVTDEQALKIQQAVEQYKIKYKKIDVTEKEVKEIIKKLGYSGIEVKRVSEVPVSQVVNRIGLDSITIDLIPTRDDSSQFAVTFHMQNNDYIDAHDRYYGNVYAWKAVAPGSYTYIRQLTIPFAESNIMPRTYRNLYYSIGVNGCGAYFEAEFYMVNDGITAGPHYNIERNYAF